MDKEKISVFECVDSFYPNIDGVMQAVNNYCSNFNESVESTVIAPKPSKKSNFKDNFTYKVFRCFSIPAPEKYRLGLPFIDFKFKKQLKNQKVDLIHTHTPFSMGRFALGLAKKRKVPFVATLHTKYYDDFLRALNGNKPLSKFALRYMMKVFNKADSAWVVSESSRKILKSYGYKGEIYVMRNGTDFVYPENASELVEKVNQIHGIKNQQNVLLFVGRVANYKNINLIANSLKRLKDEGLDYKMIVVGGGFDLEQYKKTIEKMGLSQNFIFTGIIKDRNLLQGYYLRADLFLFPSVFDTSGLVCIESSAHRLPVLVIENSCPADGVTDGVNGFLSIDDEKAYAEKIKLILSDKQKLKQVGLTAEKTLYRSWKTVSEEVLEKYKEIIKEYNEAKENKV